MNDDFATTVCRWIAFAALCVVLYAGYALFNLAGLNITIIAHNIGL